MKKYLILLFLALLPAVVPAQESDSLDVEQPATSYTLETVPNVYRLDRRLHVSDPTGILSSEARSAIDRIFTQLEDSTGIQTAVVMLPSIGEDNIFDFAHNLFMEWGVGEKERDNGLLILYVEDQRKIRFHVGYGLEGILPDAICKRIQAKYMVPAFKEGNVDQGMVTGCKAIYQTLENAMNPNKQGDGSEGAMAALAVLVVMVIVFIWIIRNAQQKALTCKKCGTKASLRLTSKDFYRTADGHRHKRETYVCSHCNAVDIRDTDQEDDDDDGDLMKGIFIGSLLNGGRGGRGFGGGFGGGGFGGSFGGGSSGGGGSTSGW